jgi:hypothetical protein
MWRRVGEEKHFQAPCLIWLFRKARKAAKEAGELFEPDEVVWAMANLEKVNHDHAIVQRGGKMAVLWEHFDPALGRYTQTYLTKDALLQKLVTPITLPVGDSQEKPSSKGPTLKQLGVFWFNSTWRRHYEGVYFAPGQTLDPSKLNLWRGWAVDPVDKPEGWAKFKRHILDHIAGGDQNAYDYLLNWMAFAVQNLRSRPGTAIVLTGPKGAGKSILIKLFGSLFGEHAFVTAHDSDITGRFNARLETTMLLGLEEAVAPQSRRADSIVKDLITRDELRLEDKFFSVWTAPNHLRIIIVEERVADIEGICPQNTPSPLYPWGDVALVGVVPATPLTALHNPVLGN